MYIERKRIAGKTYIYVKTSVRCKGRVRTRTLGYIGKEASSSEIHNVMQHLAKKEIRIQKETKEQLEKEGKKIMLLHSDQIQKLHEVHTTFRKKLATLDEQTKQEMFDDFITVYIYNTNAIEGNTLTLRDTDLLLNKGITPAGKSLREVNDHLNAKEVLNYILKEKPPLTKESIIQIHSLLMKKIDSRIGGFRTQNVRVIGATFEASPVEYVAIDMKLLLQWLSKNKGHLHPIVLAAIFHQKFERIHPFFDGNGRTGRMLSNSILIHANFPPMIVPNAQRKRYYNALSSADKTDLTTTSNEHHKIVEFFYFNMLKTFNTIFKKWGL